MRKSTFEYFANARLELSPEGRRSDEALFQTLRSCSGCYSAVYGEASAMRIGQDGQLQIGILVKPDMKQIRTFNRRLQRIIQRLAGTRKGQQEMVRVKDELKDYLESLAPADSDATLPLVFVAQDEMAVWYDRWNGKEIDGHPIFKFDPEDGSDGESGPEAADDLPMSIDDVCEALFHGEFPKGGHAHP